MIPTVTLRRALAEPRLLGKSLQGDSWYAWRVLLLAAMGEALTDTERVTFKQFTGREHEPLERVDEFVAVKGRRCGASHASGAVLCPYIAGLCKHPALARGERGVLLVLAQDQRTADGILDYAEAAFLDSPVLSQLVDTRNARELILNNGITIEVRSADARRLRGLTFISVIADEMAFWMTEGAANPDVEILNAVRPGLATTAGPLFMMSSPYARRGELWQTYQKYYGAQGNPRILVAHGSTLDFYPSFPKAVIDRAIERDPSRANAEYLALFRTDVESFVTREAVMACVTPDVRERAYQPGVRYFGFVDISGGSGDSAALAISHKAGDIVILDLIREIPGPHSPEEAIAEFAPTLKSYRLQRVQGDKYAVAFPVESFRRHGIRFEQTAPPKSDLYRGLLPVLNSRRCELLDHPKMINQLVSLERRTHWGSRDKIDHPQIHGAHDDVSNAVAGAVLAASSSAKRDVLVRAISDYGGQTFPLMKVTKNGLVPADEPPPRNPLAAGGDNVACTGEQIVDSDPVLEEVAAAFNAKHGYRRPK